MKTGDSIGRLYMQMVVTAMMTVCIGLSLPRIMEELGMSYSQGGYLISAQLFGSVLAVLFGGALSDRYGRDFIIKITMAVSILILICFGFVRSFASAAILSFILGGASIIMENAISCSGVNLKNSRVMTLLIHVGFSSGAVAVALLFFLFWRLGHWRATYFCIAGLAFVCLILSGKTATASNAEYRINYHQYFKKYHCLAGAGFIFLYVAAETGLWAMAPVYLESLDFGPESGIFSLALVWFMIMLGRICGAVLVRRISSIKILLAFGCLGTLTFLGCYYAAGFGTLAFIALTSFFFGPFFPIITDLSAKTVGDTSSSYIAFLMASGCLGAALMGGLGGIVADVYSSTLMIVPFIACFALLVVLFAIYSHHRAKAANEPIRNVRAPE